jgi:predicted ATPase
VNDAFTAVALKGVLDTLLHSGVTLVITSNRAPEDMQVGAAQQRALYEEFAATLRERCEPWQVSSTKDYRAEAAASQQGPSPLAFHSLDAASAAALDALHASACAGSACAPQTVPVMFGRTLHVARACAGVARASYAELCDRPLGAADYIALAERFHTVVLDGVPRMPAGAADVARRFITLIDELYNARCVLLFSAAAPPAELFAAAAGEAPLLDLESLQFESEAEGARSRRDVGQDGGVAPVAGTATAMAGAVAALGGAAERFAFARALSRLAEMGTASWVRRSRAPRCVQDVLLTHFA